MDCNSSEWFAQCESCKTKANGLVGLRTCLAKKTGKFFRKLGRAWPESRQWALTETHSISCDCDLGFRSTSTTKALGGVYPLRALMYEQWSKLHVAILGKRKRMAEGIVQSIFIQASWL